MTRITFLSPVQDDIFAVEKLMKSQSDGYNVELKAALDHLLSSGGKRIRPAITILLGRIFGAEYDRLITLAASIELLHTATLVHDDLIDASLLRRNIPTLNAQWSPGATVLTGDFMFAQAARLAANTESVPAIKLFAQTLSTIVNGEITQLFSTRCSADREEYYQRIYAKTASLFETAASSAALISPVDAAIVEISRGFGYEIGMAFQIIDDILDFTGEQATLGKPVGNDLRQGIVTLPAIYYVENYPKDPDVQALLNGVFFNDENRIERTVMAIRRSGAIQGALNEARVFAQRGLQHLRHLPDSPERQSLEELTEYIVQRDL
ncbi:MAG TPA: polyprenyl synthetase family protein [Anaerolineaceae bacterium]|nr:polyprenyl synthetase family protein [Anaerolineaceae bacterium]